MGTCLSNFPGFALVNTPFYLPGIFVAVDQKKERAELRTLPGVLV